ncbi:MAG: class B sortase [Defluviitaleaceae bacterium]|nr:class B sortase [Defluviitaleaceae bacterium]
MSKKSIRNREARQARNGHRGHVSESSHSLEAGSSFPAHKEASQKRRQRITLAAAIATTICAVVLAIIVIPHVRDLRAIRRELASLPDLSPFDVYWQETNPHYVGWLRIDGTIVDFPVVRGSDNVRYLTTTFRGEENIIGAIFMDYRNTDLSAPHIIIYGHQAQDEARNPLMFGALHRFVDEQYMAANPTIVFMSNDTMNEFEIFSARETDIHDPAYRLDFSAEGSFAAFLERNGAPPDATQILTLSTCIGTNNDYRMIVQGSLIRSIPVITEYDETGGWTIIMP